MGRFQVVKAWRCALGHTRSQLIVRQSVSQLQISVAAETSGRLIGWTSFARIIAERIYGQTSVHLVYVVVELIVHQIERRNAKRICSVTCERSSQTAQFNWNFRWRSWSVLAVLLDDILDEDSPRRQVIIQIKIAIVNF